MKNIEMLTYFCNLHKKIFSMGFLSLFKKKFSLTKYVNELLLTSDNLVLELSGYQYQA